MPIIRDKVVGYWAFNEVSGTRFDSQGTDDLIPRNMPPLEDCPSVAGLQGLAIDVTTTTLPANITKPAATSAFDVTNRYSFAIWVYPQTNRTGLFWLWTDALSGPGNADYLCVLNTDRTVKFNAQVFDGVSFHDLSWSTTEKVNFNQWNFIYFAWDWVASRMVISVNLVHPYEEFDISAIPLRSAPDIFVTGYPGIPDHMYLDEAVFFNDFLYSEEDPGPDDDSEDELATVYNEGSGITFSDTINIKYQFNSSAVVLVGVEALTATLTVGGGSGPDPISFSPIPVDVGLETVSASIDVEPKITFSGSSISEVLFTAASSGGSSTRMRICASRDCCAKNPYGDTVANASTVRK